MTAWRAVLAVALVCGSMLGSFWCGMCVKTPALQLLGFLVFIDVALLGVCFAQDDGAKRIKKSVESKSEVSA